jgi:hypothetical protein
LADTLERGCGVANSAGGKRGYATGRTGQLKPTIREFRLLVYKNKWRKETSSFLYFSANLCSEMSHILFSAALVFSETKRIKLCLTRYIDMWK